MQVVERIQFFTALLDRVDRWVRFAESKNGFLAALILAISGLSETFFRQETIAAFLVAFIAGFFWVCSLAVLLFSYFPKLNLKNRERLHLRKIKAMKTNNENCMFYVDIASLDLQKFKTQLSDKIGVCCSELTRVEHDILEQIHNNSKIAVIKFRKFMLALKLFGIGSFLVLTNIILTELRHV